jgi:hypothetical protein
MDTSGRAQQKEMKHNIESGHRKCGYTVIKLKQSVRSTQQAVISGICAISDYLSCIHRHETRAYNPRLIIIIIIIIIIISGVRLSPLVRPLLAYCTSPT